MPSTSTTATTAVEQQQQHGKTPDTSLEVDEEDERELQAALAASSIDTTASIDTVEAGNQSPKEVLYQHATALFKAIEDTRWAEALELCERVPSQASIWVKSTGTENTTFGWSLWRRLPIHEVSTLVVGAERDERERKRRMYIDICTCWTLYSHTHTLSFPHTLS